ncbi:MAG: translation elongation factor Ts [Lentisphaeria bacterium]
MAAISAKMVMDLRKKTGVGMMECKKALVAANGDESAAIDALREAGKSKAAKKAGRSATEGLFAVVNKDNVTVIVEVLCETDFVAKTKEFISFTNETAQKGLTKFDTDGDISKELAELVSDDLKSLIGKLGENMQVRRAYRWVSGDNTQIGTYLHTGVAYACLAEVEGECDAKLLNDICMHITASNPTYITSEDISKDVLEHEREVFKKQIQNDPKLANKPEKVLEHILIGKMEKRYTELCLMDQPWIDDDKTCLKKVAPKIIVKRFKRMLAGEELPEDAK